MKTICRRLRRGDDLLRSIEQIAREDLSTLGGHLMPGCIVNTTCELALLVLDGWRFGVEQDRETGYDEIVFREAER